MNRSTVAIILSLFCMLFLMNQSYAKSPPPGTGEADIKANILIMLDKSGSMGWAQTKPSIRCPTDVAVNSAGLVHVVDWCDKAVKIFSEDLCSKRYIDTFGNALLLNKTNILT